MKFFSVSGQIKRNYANAITIPISFRVELTSGPMRAWSIHLFAELPWHIGHATLGLLVYLIPNMRNLELFIGLFALPFLSLWFLLPESPRWLLSKGRNEEAIKVRLLTYYWQTFWNNHSQQK